MFFNWNYCFSSFLDLNVIQILICRPYVESLGKIIPWMFALDHYRYARWRTIHVKDLLELQLTCPTIYAKFQKGNFVTQKTIHMFSSLANDQVHERLNAIVKGDRGIVDITESESALNRWTVGRGS